MGSFTQPSMQGGGGYGYFAPPTGPYGLQPDSARKRPVSLLPYESLSQAMIPLSQWFSTLHFSSTHFSEICLG